jgi:hypothetical protein
MTASDAPHGTAVPFSHDRLRGLRDDGITGEVIAQALATHDDANAAKQVLKQDERSRVTAGRVDGVAFVVKEVRKAGARRRLADWFRGSPARRAFRAGRALREAGVGAARPLAFVERRHVGVPVRSLLVSEDLSHAPTAAALLESDPDRRADVLACIAFLLVGLHRGGFVHGDLRVQHVHVVPSGARLVGQLIDLESVRRTSGLSTAQRQEDLAQMNASIADDLATSDDRRAAFERYAEALPFAGGSHRALVWIARRSIERQHLFRGRDLSDGCGGRRSADPSGEA